MKKPVIIILMLLTMVLASNASKEETTAAEIEMETCHSQALVLEKETNQFLNLY